MVSLIVTAHSADKICKDYRFGNDEQLKDVSEFVEDFSKNPSSKSRDEAETRHACTGVRITEDEKNNAIPSEDLFNSEMSTLS